MKPGPETWNEITLFAVALESLLEAKQAVDNLWGKESGASQELRSTRTCITELMKRRHLGLLVSHLEDEADS